MATASRFALTRSQLFAAARAERAPLGFLKRAGHNRGMPRDPVKGST